ncbi:MAG TPA: hypothetical protein VM694_33620, partial [Polyangium sp.]|nr:hypothetical protein [Polyangium sp.]
MSEEQDPRIEDLARRTREREEKELAELLRPIDKAERSALADAVFAELDAKRAPEEARPAPVVPIERLQKGGARRRFGFVGVLLAAALGALALFVLLRRDAPAPIAAYTLSVEGGNQAERGDRPPEDVVIRLDPASRLSLALRPESPVAGAIAVRGFLVREGAAKPWEPPMVVGAGGVVRIEGTAAALFGDVPEGAWDVVLLVGRPEALPDETTLAKAAASGDNLAALSTHRLRITLSRPRGALGGGNEGAPKHQVSACAVVPAEVLPDVLVQAEAARKRGELDRASSLVEGVLVQGPPDARRAAIRQKARILMATRGRFDEAAALFREAITQDHAAGRLSDALDDTFALSYGLLLDKRAFGEARALLDGLGPLLAACPEGEPKAAYYKGLLGIETGDLRAALASFSAAAAGAERLGLDAYRSAVLEQEAEVLAVLGRHEEAAARLGKARALAGPSADACRRAQLASNAGWIALRASARSGRGLDDAQRGLEEALVITREGCPAGLGNVLVNLALVEHERGRGKEARARLEEAKRAGGWAELGGWQRMIEARLLLSEGNPKDALAAHEALRAEGERLLLPELVFEGALGRAEALA